MPRPSSRTSRSAISHAHHRRTGAYNSQHAVGDDPMAPIEVRLIDISTGTLTTLVYPHAVATP